MKKKVTAMVIALAGVWTFAGISVKEAKAEVNVNESTYARDTHCTKCGTHNGRWRCPSFCPVKGRPTDCQCGHEKGNHVGC